MATVHDCDRCHKQVGDQDRGKDDFVVLSLAKLGTGAPPFKRLELCKECGNAVRHLLASPVVMGIPTGES